MFASIVILLLAGFLTASDAAIKGTNDYVRYQQQVGDTGKNMLYNELPLEILENAQEPMPISDCFHVSLEVGAFKYISTSNDDRVCGLYLMADFNKKIEVHFSKFDVPCDHGGLVAVVDGWELNQEVFPSKLDHPRLIDERFTEFCGVHVRRSFVSSQNVALIQYRIPNAGRGFVVNVKHVDNPMPCNVLTMGTTEEFTLRNYGRQVNCTLTAISPGLVRIIGHNVGSTSTLGPVHTTETGTLRECGKNRPKDVVQIGGSNGLDTSNLEILDEFCGISSKPDFADKFIAAEVTSVRLVSSGSFDNSVTAMIRPVLPEENQLNP